MLERLNSLLAHVTAPRGPSFYRMLYGLREDAPALSVDSLEEWRSLPMLTKERLLETPLHERSFVPRERLDSYYASSGTTGSLPLFGPRACVRGPAYRRAFHDFRKPTLSSLILPHMTERALHAEGSTGRVIALDPKRLRASVALARAAGADSILAHSFLMPLIGESLVEAGMAESIRYVEIAGEPCSSSQYERMRRLLPRATIASVYGAREVEGPIGIPCRALGGEPLEVYHPHPDYYLEIIDDEGRPRDPSAGTEGELLVTAYAGEPFAFPLLRYRINDRVRIVESPCAAHGTWSFTVLGRTHADFAKMPGGVLRADEIRRVLAHVGVEAPDEFQAEIVELPGPGPSFSLLLRCALPRSLDADAFAARVADTLRVAPAYTYGDGVRAGVYAPLRHEPLAERGGPAKRARIVRRA